MSIYKELSYDQDIETVKGLQFSIMGPDEILRRSVVEVTKTDTYNGHEPVINGLFDPRMGVLEHNRVCATCEQKNIFCPGHFGHIKLARPVYNALLFETVRKLMRCVCFRCSRLLVSPMDCSEDLRVHVKKAMATKNLQKRWDIMSKLCQKMRKCGDDGCAAGCGAKQPTRYARENNLKVVAEWKDGAETTRQDITPEDAMRIFRRMTEEDMIAIGFNPKWNRPEWMICTVMPVPPPAVRPSIIEESGQRREDDLTHKLCDILKTNQQLQQKIDRGKASEEHIAVMTGALQYHVATFLDNQIPGLPPSLQRNGRKLKSISDRLKKKEGRIRGNLNGKRVDQSARSVITPDPYISLDELGVPIKVAMNLTFPEKVNAYNINHLRTLVLHGPETWPGAKYVRKATDGRTYTLKIADREKVAADLVEGDTVDRHLADGDYVLFNRQPSLHRMSMMCYQVKVMPFQTFRLSVLTTTPLNADFDGDEMNLMMPQSIQTMTELFDFASVPFHIVSPKDSKPVIEVIQDSMSGSFLLTKNHVRIPDKTFANLQMVNSYFDGVLPKAKDGSQYTGFQASTAILPPNFFVDLKNKKGERVLIRNSEHVSGTLDKSVFHAQSRGIVPVIFHDYSPFEVRRYLDNIQRMICRWLMTYGFSVGISDLVVDPNIQATIRELVATMKANVDKHLEEARLGRLDNNSIQTNADWVETQLLNTLNEATSKIEKEGLHTLNDLTNRMINMVRSGAKGKDTNVAQMVASVGQQNVDGKRVSYGFTNRTLPHYCKYDDGPGARGYVENSFLSGLTPQEMFFHAMGGREGLIDTAVKTSETGYIQRRLVKAMEDAKIYYDYTVRNATGQIVQFVYGEDGMDGTKIESQSIPTLTMNLLELEQKYLLRSDDLLSLHMQPDAVAKLRDAGENDWPVTARKHFDQLLQDRDFMLRKVFANQKPDKILYPIAFERLVKTAAERLAVAGLNHVPTDLTPGHVLKTLDALVDELIITQPGQGTRFFGTLLRAYMSPKPLIFEHRLHREAFDWIVEQIRAKFREAVAQPGEMVGIIAAQSIGESNTQLTLDSFHVSGTVAAVKATSGVPRLKELLSVSKNIKTPSMTIYLKPDVGTVERPEGPKDPRLAEAKERAFAVLRQLEITRLSDLIDSTEIFWDPPGAAGLETGIPDDDGMMAAYRAFQAARPSRCRSTSPWVLRILLNKAKLHHVRLTMLDIYTRIHLAYHQTIDCSFADDNEERIVLHIRLTEAGLKDIEADDIVAALKAVEHNVLHSVLLKGIHKINRVSMDKKTADRYVPELDAYESVNEWVLTTDGTNFQDIIANPNVDPYRTLTNDIWEIYRTLGIEAARAVLYHELNQIIDESSISYRHMAMLLDTIMSRGSLMSIDRHGINRGDVGPLAKSSFEETTDMLIKASIFSDVDRINGVSANIMLGQLPPCGTGDSEILLDEDRYLAMLSGAANPSAQAYAQTAFPETESGVCEIPTAPRRRPAPVLPKWMMEALPAM